MALEKNCYFDLQLNKENFYNDLLGEDYVNNFLRLKKNIKEENYTILTIYTQGCIGCVETMLENINQNKEKYEKLPFYVIISGQKVNIDRKLKDYPNIKNFRNLVIDSTEIIGNMTKINGLKNSRLTIIKNNEVVMDSIFDTPHIETGLIPIMLKNIGIE
jgi:hypothetical protein